MKSILSKLSQNKDFPVFIERDEDGFYVAECPLFKGCYSQGDTADEAVENLKEVIGLCLEEKINRDILKTYNPRSVSWRSISL